MKIPTPGSTITVTTRYPSIQYGVDEKYDTHHLSGTVVPSERWFDADWFALKTNAPGYPVSIISTKNVVEIDGVEFVQEEAQPARDVMYTYQGSADTPYAIVQSGGDSWSCDCPGFAYRRKCKHIVHFRGF